jgi:hypothetical protein
LSGFRSDWSEAAAPSSQPRCCSTSWAWLNPLVDWRIAGEFIAGGIVGGLVGMMLANRLSHGKDTLTRIFAVLIFVVAAYVLYHSGQTMMS